MPGKHAREALRSPYLTKLCGEIRFAGLRIADLAQSESNDDGHQEVCERVIKVRVHWVATSSFQQIQQGRPRSKEYERDDHEGDGAAFVLDELHGCRFDSSVTEQGQAHKLRLQC